MEQSLLSLMNVAPTTTTTDMHEENVASLSPRRVSLDENSLKDIIANRLLSSDDDYYDKNDDMEEDEAVIIRSCNCSNKKRKIDESSSLSKTSCMRQKKKACTRNNNRKNHNKLLRFQMEPIILGTSAFVEDNDDVWYSRHELAAIRQDCKAMIVGSGGNVALLGHNDVVAEEIMRLYNNNNNNNNNNHIEDTTSTTNTTTTYTEPINHTSHVLPVEFIQLRGLERWTSQFQYHIRQMASKTLRSELYIAQSLQRLHLVETHNNSTTETPPEDDTTTLSTTPQERLAEISRFYSQTAVALAVRLAQVDAMQL